MATETVENYLKAIYTLAREPGSGAPAGAAGAATVTRVAAVLGVTPGTATAMLRKLAAGGLARYQRYGAATLTPKGERAALDVLRRHRVLEQFLVQIVGLDWSEVHEEAERLEHAVSPRLLERLDRMLGRPPADPHGDPIPDAGGRVPPQRGLPLSAAHAGVRVRIARVLDQSPEFLRFAEASALRPGRTARVVRVDPAADAVVVRNEHKKEVTISRSAAAKVLVLPAE
ncbi:MAG: metal-dependent transcriptional regulator [Chloroflexi bacterium]|nr:metal-dependent transcriptional regulator [Chloroflexota bacterium]